MAPSSGHTTTPLDDRGVQQRKRLLRTPNPTDKRPFPIRILTWLAKSYLSGLGNMGATLGPSELGASTALWAQGSTTPERIKTSASATSIAARDRPQSASASKTGKAARPRHRKGAPSTSGSIRAQNSASAAQQVRAKEFQSTDGTCGSLAESPILAESRNVSSRLPTASGSDRSTGSGVSAQPEAPDAAPTGVTASTMQPQNGAETAPESSTQRGVADVVRSTGKDNVATDDTQLSAHDQVQKQGSLSVSSGDHGSAVDTNARVATPYPDAAADGNGDSVPADNTGDGDGARPQTLQEEARAQVSLPPVPLPRQSFNCVQYFTILRGSGRSIVEISEGSPVSMQPGDAVDLLAICAKSRTQAPAEARAAARPSSIYARHGVLSSTNDALSDERNGNHADASQNSTLLEAASEGARSAQTAERLESARNPDAGNFASERPCELPSMLDELRSVGLELSDLAAEAKPQRAYRRHYAAWLTNVLHRPRPRGIEFRRILVIDGDRAQSYKRVIQHAFGFLTLLCSGRTGIRSVMFPLCLEYAADAVDVLTYLLDAALRWCSAGLSLPLIRILVPRGFCTPSVQRLLSSFRECMDEEGRYDPKRSKSEHVASVQTGDGVGDAPPLSGALGETRSELAPELVSPVADTIATSQAMASSKRRLERDFFVLYHRDDTKVAWEIIHVLRVRFGFKVFDVHSRALDVAATELVERQEWDIAAPSNDAGLRTAHWGFPNLSGASATPATVGPQTVDTTTLTSKGDAQGVTRGSLRERALQRHAADAVTEPLESGPEHSVADDEPGVSAETPAMDGAEQAPATADLTGASLAAAAAARNDHRGAAPTTHRTASNPGQGQHRSSSDRSEPVASAERIGFVEGTTVALGAAEHSHYAQQSEQGRADGPVSPDQEADIRSAFFMDEWYSSMLHSKRFVALVSDGFFRSPQCATLFSLALCRALERGPETVFMIYWRSTDLPALVHCIPKSSILDCRESNHEALTRSIGELAQIHRRLERVDHLRQQQSRSALAQQMWQQQQQQQQQSALASDARGRALEERRTMQGPADAASALSSGWLADKSTRPDRDLHTEAQRALQAARTRDLNAAGEASQQQQQQQQQQAEDGPIDGSTASEMEYYGNAPLLFDREWREKWDIPYEELRFGSKLGAGAFGEVFMAEWRGVIVAVKQLTRDDDGYSLETVEDFQKEMVLLSRLKHPNIVPFIGAVTKSQHLCIVLGFVSGGSLYRLIHARKAAADGPAFSLAEIAQLALGIAQGVQYLHAQQPPVIHRDLKSPNVLIDAETGTPIVTDFGLSRSRVHTMLATGAAGTPEWMAPEVMRQETVDEKSDVWSYGVIVWELITSDKPWSDEHPIQVIYRVAQRGERLRAPPDTDEGLKSLLDGCFRQRRQQRPTFDEIVAFWQAFQRVLRERERTRNAALPTPHLSTIVERYRTQKRAARRGPPLRA